MNLIIQIQSLFYSFLYGLFVSILFNLCYKMIFVKNLILRLIINLLYSIIIYFLYFYFLYKINNGIIHIYFFIVTLIGFFTYNRLFVKMRVK